MRPSKIALRVLLFFLRKKKTVLLIHQFLISACCPRTEMWSSRVMTVPPTNATTINHRSVQQQLPSSDIQRCQHPPVSLPHARFFECGSRSVSIIDLRFLRYLRDRPARCPRTPSTCSSRSPPPSHRRTTAMTPSTLSRPPSRRKMAQSRPFRSPNSRSGRWKPW